MSQATAAEDSLAVELLTRVMAPASSPCPGGFGQPSDACLDSLSVLATYRLADRLVEAEHPSTSAWLRWAARHGSAWPIPPQLFRPVVVQAYSDAAARVRRQPDPEFGDIRTAWSWPETADLNGDGELRVEAVGPAPDASVSLDGAALPEGGRLLPPGSYTLQVAAPGYESVELTREVLPGVTTAVTVELAPLLPPEAVTGARGSTVGVWSPSATGEVCTNGVRSAPGQVTTLLSRIDPEAPLTVTTPDGVFTGARVVRRDPVEDLAVLQVAGVGDGPGTGVTTAEAVEGQYAWALSEKGCGPVEPSRTRLWALEPSAPGAGPIVAWRMDPALTEPEVGAPVVDRSGALLGMATARDRMLSWSYAQALLDQAIVAVQEPAEAQQPGEGGGFPWKIAGGAGAAALLGVVLFSGGDDGGGGGSDSGTLVLRIPGS
ncbi:MAG: hypothetical protein P8188_13420 [Gemmatimonadota bacterium]